VTPTSHAHAPTCRFQCTRSDRGAGGNDVCNALTKRCENGKTDHSAEECGAYVSDDQCQDEYLCRAMTFGAESLGHFCLPRLYNRCEW
jgi:hypothetical protein